MPAVILAPAAEADLLSIALYISTDSPAAADRVLDRLREGMERLLENPSIGRPREVLAPGLRSWPVGNYVVFYRSCPGGIEVVRVLHGARDLRRGFPPPAH